MGKHLAPGSRSSQNQGEETISGHVTIGASGAVGTVVGKGFSIARTAAGRYTITLKRTYHKLLFPSGSIVYAAFGTIDKLLVEFSNYSATAGTIMLLVKPGDSTTLTDPGNGDAVAFQLVMLKSKVSV